MLQFVLLMTTASLDINKQIGSRIKEARLSAKLTQNQLGKKIYKTGAAVGLIERGARGVNVETLIEIAHVLSVPIDYFFSSEKTTTQYLHDTLENLRESTKSLSESLSKNRETVEKLMLELPKTEDLRILADMSMDPFILATRTGKILYITSSIRDLAGYSADDLIGKNMTYILPKKYIAWSFKNLAKLFANKQVRNLQAYLKHKNGHLVHVEVNAQVVKKDGKTIAMGVIRDISKRKSVEEDLKYRIKIEKLITSVSTKLINIRQQDIDYEIKKSFALVGRFIGADRISVFLFSVNRKKETMVCEWCRKGVTSYQESLQNLEAKDFSWFTKQIVKRRVVEVPKVSELPPEASPEKRIYESEDIQSLVSVPIDFTGELAGFIGFVWVRREAMWKDEDIRLLKMLGEISVNALSRKFSHNSKKGKQFLLEELSCKPRK
jgi:PAS domain S-box-containing protein